MFFLSDFNFIHTFCGLCLDNICDPAVRKAPQALSSCLNRDWDLSLTWLKELLHASGFSPLQQAISS